MSTNQHPIWKNLGDYAASESLSSKSTGTCRVRAAGMRAALRLPGKVSRHVGQLGAAPAKAAGQVTTNLRSAAMEGSDVK